MKQNYLYIGLVVLLLITGFVVYKAVAPAPDLPPVEEEEIISLPDADPSLVVSAVLSKTKANTVVLNVSNLRSMYATVGYELTYDSQGLIKGVNSGSKPIDVSNQDGLEREVYLGTCSRNVCKPDLGVENVSIVLEFTDTSNKKSQFSKDFEL